MEPSAVWLVMVSLMRSFLCQDDRDRPSWWSCFNDSVGPDLDRLRKAPKDQMSYAELAKFSAQVHVALHMADHTEGQVRSDCSHPWPRELPGEAAHPRSISPAAPLSESLIRIRASVRCPGRTDILKISEYRISVVSTRDQFGLCCMPSVAGNLSAQAEKRGARLFPPGWERISAITYIYILIYLSIYLRCFAESQIENTANIANIHRLYNTPRKTQEKLLFTTCLRSRSQ